MGYRIGVSSGIYSVARPEELSTSIRKLGYALTRGTSVIEIAADVPNEVTETEGRDMRDLSKKQGIDLLFHGSLTVPMGMPERAGWRDAHDHICKSFRSATFAGAKYVNFHASLQIWLELITYAGSKMTQAFCDHEGNFITKMLKDDKRLRDWFIEHRMNDYLYEILTPEERSRVSIIERTLEEEYNTKSIAIKNRMVVIDGRPPELSQEQGNKLLEELNKVYGTKINNVRKDLVVDKLTKGDPWETEELRANNGVIDGYMIMAHHMFFTRDPIWTAFADMYKDALKDYKMNYSDNDWLRKAWREAEDNNDRKFKEFFYAAVAAKYLEGHIKKALEWVDKEFIGKELVGKDSELVDYAKNMVIAIECPDARDPQHGGLHLLWSPRQIYAAVKTIRKILNTNRVWMLMDYEHVATQGVDPIKDMEETIKLAPDFGKYTLSVHANAPNPLQPHNPIEMGDIRIYKLLWMLRKTGFGKDHDVYLIFERGGGDDPFKQSVEVLRLMVEHLQKDIQPDNLPPEFFGIKGGTGGDFKRQTQIIRDHAYEPLKDLIEMPEEEWTMLSQAAIKKGKRPEQWKKAEFR